MYKISKLPNVGQISKNTISHLISNILIYPPQNGILNIFNWNKNPFFLLEKNFVIRIFFRKKFSETKIDGIFIFLKRKIFQKSVSDWKIFLEKLLKKNQNFFFVSRTKNVFKKQSKEYKKLLVFFLQCARVWMFSLIKGNLKFSSAITSTSKLIFFIPHIQIFKLWVCFFFVFFCFASVHSKNIFSPTPLFLISIPHMNQNLNNMFFVNGIWFETIHFICFVLFDAKGWSYFEMKNK